MESESSLLGTTRVHTHTYSMYRNIWARIITSLALFSSCQNCLSFVSLSFLTSSGAPSSLPTPHSLTFLSLITVDIFKSSSSACDSFFQLTDLRRPLPPSPSFSSKMSAAALNGSGRCHDSHQSEGAVTPAQSAEVIN